MRKILLISLLSIVTFNAPAFAAPEHFNCVPATKRTFPVTGLIASGLSERDYNDVLD